MGKHKTPETVKLWGETGGTYSCETRWHIAVNDGLAWLWVGPRSLPPLTEFDPQFSIATSNPGYLRGKVSLPTVWVHRGSQRRGNFWDGGTHCVTPAAHWCGCGSVWWNKSTRNRRKRKVVLGNRDLPISAKFRRAFGGGERNSQRYDPPTSPIVKETDPPPSIVLYNTME